MKKIVLTLALMIATLTVAAENILYFTYNQAARTVACLNNQDELMIYCGYEDELPTYVLINEVWAEQISSSFYEIWLYGYDAYTGEEVYMPIDLECIYLMQNRNIYSAAQYLRFKYTHRRPTFAWAMPPYNPFVRAPRPVVYYYTYHYDIHRPGWHYRNYPHMHYHPYYRRLPHYPAPMPPRPFTPGVNRPGYTENPNGGFTYTNEPLVGHITATRSQTRVQNDPTQRSGNRITSNRGENTITTTDRVSGSRTTSTAPSRTGEVSNGSSRGTGTSNRSGVSSDNNSSRGTGTSNRSGVSSDNNSSRGTGSSNRSGVSSDNNSSRSSSSSNRSGVSSDNNSSRSSSSSNRSGVSSDNNSSRSSSSSNRSGVTSDNKSSRSAGTSSRSGSNTNNTSTRTSSTSSNRSGASSERGSNNSRGTSSSSSRGGNTNRGSN